MQGKLEKTIGGALVIALDYMTSLRVHPSRAFEWLDSTGATRFGKYSWPGWWI